MIFFLSRLLFEETGTLLAQFQGNSMLLALMGGGCRIKRAGGRKQLADIGSSQAGGRERGWRWQH